MVTAYIWPEDEEHEILRTEEEIEGKIAELRRSIQLLEAALDGKLPFNPYSSEYMWLTADEGHDWYLGTKDLFGV